MSRQRWSMMSSGTKRDDRISGTPAARCVVEQLRIRTSTNKNHRPGQPILKTYLCHLILFIVCSFAWVFVSSFHLLLSFNVFYALSFLFIYYCIVCLFLIFPVWYFTKSDPIGLLSFVKSWIVLSLFIKLINCPSHSLHTSFHSIIIILSTPSFFLGSHYTWLFEQEITQSQTHWYRLPTSSAHSLWLLFVCHQTMYIFFQGHFLSAESCCPRLDSTCSN